MRILHIANFSWFSNKRQRADSLAKYYATDRKITNGLIRNGHCLWNFSYRDTARYCSPLGMGKKMGAKKMNDYLIRLARQFKPDLILLGHCEIVTDVALRNLRDCLPNVRIAQWWVDWFAEHSLDHLRAKQPYLDAFFATTAPSYYGEFITTKESPPLYFLPNIADTSIENERAFAATQHEYDVFFAGAYSSERADTLQRIRDNGNYKCSFFGFDGAPLLGGHELSTAIGKSKIGINLSRAIDIPLYTSGRLTQLTGNGCLAITPQTPQMTALFNNDEVVYYDTDDALIACIERYAKDDAARRKIAEAGWRRVHQSYNEKRVAQFMVEAATSADFSESYEWQFATITNA